MTDNDRIAELFGEDFRAEVAAVEDGTAPRVDPRHPDRPQHPDFWELGEVVRENDALVDKRRLELEDILILGGLDPGSVDYMARQRVARGMAAPVPPGLSAEEAQVIRGFGAFMDGFLLAWRLAQRRAPTVQQVLDKSIDGQHRSP